MAKEKKKKWYSIIAPKLLNSIEVGETYAYDLGFKSVCALPLARTSYLAGEQEKCMMS